MALVTPTNGAWARSRPVRNAEMPTWQSASGTVALSTGTAATTTISLATIFHTANMKSKIDVMSAIVSQAGGSGVGSGIKLHLGKITAPGAGGTVNNPVAVDGRDTEPDPSASTGTDFVECRYGGGAPTRGAILYTYMISHASADDVDMVEIMRSWLGKLPCLNQGVGEGLELYIVTGGTGPAVAADIAVTWRFAIRRP